MRPVSRRKLTSHDADALWWLAQVCSRDAYQWRPELGYVWVARGWAVATDSYRALVLPVDMTDEGLIDADDALTGGTVTVRHVGTVPGELYRDDMWSRTMAIPPRPVGALVLPQPAVDALARWRRRGTWFDGPTPDRSLAYFVPSWWDPRGARLSLPDVTVLTRLELGGTVGPCAVQAPWLASLVVPLAQEYEHALGITGGPTGHVLEIGPNPHVGPATEGWGIVATERLGDTAARTLAAVTAREAHQ